MKILKKSIDTQWLLLALALLNVAIPITMNFASAPQWVKEYSGLTWAILAVLIVVFVVVRIAQDYSSQSDNQSDKNMTQRPFSPYIIGPPINSPTHFFGRRAEVDRFFTNLNYSHPHSLQVLGLRRAGKTSFLRHLSHPEVVRKKALDGAKTLVIYINLQAGIRTVGDFYLKLAEGINKSLPKPKRLAPPSGGFPTTRAFSTWLDSPGLADYRLIILLDEFEALLGQAAFDANFFRGLCSLASRRLAWVTTSYRDLYRLSGLLGKDKDISPFFNIFHPTPIILGGLPTTFADDLIQKPATSLGVRFSSQEIVSIKQLAGRLPFFLQIAAEAWFEAKQQGQEDFYQIKAEVKRKFASATANHFDWYWRHFDEDERVLLACLATETPTEWLHEQHGDVVLDELLNYGLITQEGESYRIAGELFAESIRQRVDMPSPDFRLQIKGQTEKATYQ
jgi:hypothetical protein